MKNLTITLAIIISLFFIAVSFMADKNEDLSKYHFTGKDDLQDYQGAIADYSKAIELNPNE